MDQLKTMKETLMACVQSQMSNLQNVDAKELGEAVDMIKDLAEAIYYCDISKAMEKSEENKEIAANMVTPNINYYYPPVYYEDGRRRYSDMDNRRYYSGNAEYTMGYNNANRYTDMRGYSDSSSSNGNSRMYGGYYGDYMGRDYREGRSPIVRRMYMETKEMHQGEEKQKEELEKYMNELSKDVMEMINDSTPDEKAILSQKLQTLAQKII